MAIFVAVFSSIRRSNTVSKLKIERLRQLNMINRMVFNINASIQIANYIIAASLFATHTHTCARSFTLKHLLLFQQVIYASLLPSRLLLFLFYFSFCFFFLFWIYSAVHESPEKFCAVNLFEHICMHAREMIWCNWDRLRNARRANISESATLPRRITKGYQPNNNHHICNRNNDTVLMTRHEISGHRWLLTIYKPFSSLPA